MFALHLKLVYDWNHMTTMGPPWDRWVSSISGFKIKSPRWLLVDRQDQTAHFKGIVLNNPDKIIDRTYGPVD